MRWPFHRTRARACLSRPGRGLWHPIPWLLMVGTVLLAPTGDGARAEDRPVTARVTVFLLPAEGFPPKAAARISHAFVRALHQNRKLVVKDPDKLLLEFAGEIPAATIEKATQLMEEGTQHSLKGRLPEAVETLTRATAELELVLPYIKKQQLANAQMALGVALAKAGNRREAYQTLSKLLLWRPKMTYDTRMFDPRFLPLFTRAQTANSRLPRGSVELTTQPTGAKAYVDGRFVGITPTIAFGLTVGEHYATFKLEGYVKVVQKVEVSPSRQEKCALELKQSEKFLLLQQSLTNAQSDLGQLKASQPMVDLRSFLFIDQVIFATVRFAGTDSIDVDAHLYDLRTKVRLNRTSLTMKVKTLAEMERLTRLLYQNVRYDGVLEAPPEPPPPPPKKRTPLYAAWWFWTAVAVGVATAVLVPVLAVPETTSCSEGKFCFTFRD